VNHISKRIILNGEKLRMLTLLSLNPAYEFSSLMRATEAELKKMGDIEPRVTYHLVGKISDQLRRSPEYRSTCAELGVKPFVTDIVEDEAQRELTRIEAALTGVTGHSIRLRALLSALADQVLRKGEKALVWVSYPVEQKLIAALLDMLNIRTRALLADLSAPARARLE
jgi:hypothetical protein